MKLISEFPSLFTLEFSSESEIIISDGNLVLHEYKQITQSGFVCQTVGVNT